MTVALGALFDMIRILQLNTNPFAGKILARFFQILHGAG